jgi:hypothetical protein
MTTNSSINVNASLDRRRTLLRNPATKWVMLDYAQMPPKVRQFFKSKKTVPFTALKFSNH